MMLVDEPTEVYQVENSVGQKGTCYVYVDGFEVHWNKLIVSNTMESIEEYGIRKV